MAASGHGRLADAGPQRFASKVQPRNPLDHFFFQTRIPTFWDAMLLGTSWKPLDGSIHGPLSSSFFYGLFLESYKVIPKKELLRGPWIEPP